MSKTTTVRAPSMGTMMSVETLLHTVSTHAQSQLRPLVAEIDCKGLYPTEYLHELGALGGFSAIGATELGGSDLGLSAQIRVLSAVGSECGATAFMGWCQSACAWYLRQSSNATVRAKYLPEILSGKQLAGTGMSNTVKHLAGIEKHLLQAQPTDGGYLVNGVLPWVSNLGADHVFAATAQLPDNTYVMFMAGGQTAGVTLKPCAEFCALEGTGTLNVRFDNVFIAHDEVLAEPNEFKDYIQRIKSGFILLQMGIGAGVIEGCLNVIRQSNIGAVAEVNAFLDDDEATLRAELNDILAQTLPLADAVYAGAVTAEQRLQVLKLRLAASELALRAAQSAALHAGAKGYQVRHAAQRRTREAMFVAIVTPAIKHLRKEIHLLEQTTNALEQAS